MNISRLLIVTLMTAGLALWAPGSLSADGPDYGCDASRDACVEGCDNQADTGKGANAYNACLKRCENAYKSCTQRQEVATGCAESFRSCIGNARGDDDAMEACRDAYRQCKGQ
ncbi:MAG: hypothetical protein KDK25_09040 [Leptospiraceae bacterium]|nr:hypothetical protein [Leptospiraceae bacterium]